MLALIAVCLTLGALGSSRVDRLLQQLAGLASTLYSAFWAFWESALVQAAWAKALALITAIAAADLGDKLADHIQRITGDPGWDGDLEALMIWGALGAFIVWLSYTVDEDRRRAELLNKYHGEERRELLRTLQKQPLPKHPGTVFFCTALSATVGLWAVHDMGWDASLAWTAGLTLPWLYLTLHESPTLTPELPEQSQFGDAHWATLSELRERTSLLHEAPKELGLRRRSRRGPRVSAMARNQATSTRQSGVGPFRGAVVIVLVIAAVFGLIAKQLYGIAIAMVLAVILRALGIHPNHDPGSVLPEQEQFGDAHWATLDELRQRTALFNQNHGHFK